MGPEEWLVPGPRLGTRRGQELARRLQQQQLKQQSMVREPGFSLVLEAAAFPAGPAQFLGSEASQGRGRRLLRQRLLRRQLSSELLEAWCPVHQALAPRELGSQVLGSQVLESQVLESQVLESQELCHQLQLLKQPNSVSAVLISSAPSCSGQRRGVTCPGSHSKSLGGHWQSWDLELLGPGTMSPPLVSYHKAMGLSDGRVPVWHSQRRQRP